MDVWFIDDRAENRATWLASFPADVHAACALRVFASVPELCAALEAGDRPTVVFVDYFLSGHHGTDVIERLLDGDGPVPLIVAHSSMTRANEGMVRAGAHFAMEKVRGVARTQSIATAIRSVEDLRRLIRRHLGPQGD